MKNNNNEFSKDNDKTLDIPNMGNINPTFETPVTEEFIIEEITVEPVISDGGNMNNNNNKNSKKKKDKKKKQGKSPLYLRIIAWFLSITAGLFVAGVVVVSIFVTSVIASPKKIDAETFNKNDSTVVLDANDNIIYDLGEKLIENVEYDEIAQSLIDAFISIEDSRFFEHDGFDVPRFSNAMIDNGISSIKNMSLTFDGGGASTIDMQLIKNFVFSSENSKTGEAVTPADSGIDGIKRKVSEIYYAKYINSKKILDKKVIFQKYVNAINFGAGFNTLGVQKAANFYFNKDVSELGLVESAFLAGVVNAPARYTPYYKLSLATERTHTVLELMNFHGYITDAELERALTVPLENLFVEQIQNRADALPNQAYIDIVLEEVEELTGLNPATNSMVIKTAMNPELQRQLDRAQNREIASLDISSVKNSQMQLAATVIDNKTGEVIASFGGYDYYGQRIINRSYDALYQPGSTVKPLLAYAPAFEYLGYSTSHVITDEPYKWAGTDQYLNNWSRKYYGQVPLLRAISSSYNIPAVKTYDEVHAKIGQDKYEDYVEAIGFKRYAQNLDDYYESIGSNLRGKDKLNSQFAIGGNDFYTNTQELAGALSVMMNGGEYIKPHTIREVEILDTGEIIKSPHKATPVISDAAAYLTAYTMKNVIDANPWGGVERHVARKYPVYAKTGTSNWSGTDRETFKVPAGSAKDRLLLTATDKFSIASWSGFDPSYINKKDGKAYHSESEKSFQIQAKINGFILDNLEKQYGPGVAIKQPSSVSQITHILGTFPYQSPLTGMNPDLITTGFVKSDFASLVPATPPTLEEFAGSKVEMVQENNKSYINVTYNDYPDPEKLIKAPPTLEMPFGSSTVTGVRLYDPSWVFGPVRYTTEVFINGNVVETVKSDVPTQLIRVDAKPGQDIKVCTFYSFELNDTVASKKTCHEIDMKELTIELPNFSTKKYSDLQLFAQEYDITLNTSYTSFGTLAQFLNITKAGNYTTATSAKVSDIQGTTWEVNLVDHTVNVASFKNKKASEFKNTYDRYVPIEIIGDPSKPILEVRNKDGIPLDRFNLSDYYAKDVKIFVHTENANQD